MTKTIKLKTDFYEGVDVGYSQYFGENPAWYQKFGLKGHNGLDIPLNTGTKLYSVIDGVVTEQTSDPSGYGNYVKIENDICGVLYAHLSKFVLTVGQTVSAGDLIGYSGNTGNSTGPHLHFGVFPKPRDRSNGYAGYINPLGSEVEWVNSFDEDADSKIKELEEKVEELRTQRESYRKEVADLEEKLRLMTDDRNRLAQDAARLQVKLNEVLDRHAEELKTKQDHIDSIQLTLSEVNQQHSALTNQYAKLSEENESNKATLSNAQQKFIRYEEELMGFENLVSTRDNEIVKLKTEISKLKADKKKKLSEFPKWELIKALFS